MAAETSPEVQAGEHPVVLFDGYCHLCDGTVNFIIARDRRAQFRFAPLQSSAGEALLQQCGLPARAESIVLVEGKRCFTRSGAALRIAWRLDPPWPVLYGFMVVPQFLRDAVYNFIAVNRYRWFGRRGSCRIPSPEERARFLA